MLTDVRDAVTTPGDSRVTIHFSSIAEMEIDVLPWVSRCALEYVCQGGLGHSFDALNPHSENEYIHAVRMLGYGRYLCAAFPRC